jgi:hypothetical protein
MNLAVSECDPTGSVVVVDTTPPVTGAGAPMLVMPSWNCTEPSKSGGVTVAVIVTAVPAATGEGGKAVTVVDKVSPGLRVHLVRRPL